MKTNAWGRVAAIAVAATVASGCKSVEEVADAHARAIRERLDVIRAIHDDAAVRPPLTTNEIIAPERGFAFDYWVASGRDTAIAYLEDLTRPGELAPVYARLPRTDEIARCAALVEHHTEAYDPGNTARWTWNVEPADAERYLTSCERSNYLIVVRVTDFVRPVQVKTDQFDGGRVEAEILVYALKGADGAPFQRLGGFRTFATSQPRVGYFGDLQRERQVEDDLRKQQVAMLSGGLTKAAPGTAVRL